MIYLRSLLFSTGMLVSMVFFSLAGILLFLLFVPFPVRYRFTTRWGRFTIWWLKVTCGIDYRVEGRENIPEGPAIVFSKHQSTWETLALQQIFPPQVWVLKRELMWLPLFGWTMATLKPIAIDRSAGRKAVNKIVEIGTRRLRSGLWVVIFPEGTRVPPGETRRYGIGGAVLAEKSGYPVVPVAHNAGEFWPRRAFLKRPGTIRVVIGPPIESKGRTAAEINRLAREWIEQAMGRIARASTTAESGNGKRV